jgi:protoporphyrinogen oxidase
VTEVVILGAGLTGLSCAYHLEQAGFFNFKIFEKNKREGGLLRSFTQDDFTFDFTGHLLHVNDDYFLQFLNNIAGIQHFDLITRQSAIYIQEKLTPYPFQMNLYGLNSPIILDVICGFIHRKKHLRKPQNFYDWVLKYFGRGLGKHFFFPYNTKLLSYNIKKITASWTGRFVPKTNLKTMITNTLHPKLQHNIGYNCQFYYPKHGGIEFLITNLRKNIKSNIHTNHNAIEIDTKNKTVYFENGHKQRYNVLVNTIPLNHLLKQLKRETSNNITSLHSKLLCNTVLNFNLGFSLDRLPKKHWIYFPEKKFSFYRVGFWHNINQNAVPKHCSAIYGELSYLPGTKTKKQIQNLKKKAIEQALKTLKIDTSTITTEKILYLDHAYVIYDAWREKNLTKILKRLKNSTIYSVGRYGAWKYASMQEAVLDGKKISEEIMQQLQPYNRSSKSNEKFKRVLS